MLPDRSDSVVGRPDRWLVAATVAWAACLLYLTLAPRLPTFGSDDGSELSSWGHVLGTMVLAALLYLVLAGLGTHPRWQIAGAVALAATLFGVAIEGVQALTSYRDPSVADALLDAAGAVVAVAALSASRFRLETASRLATRGTAVLVVAVVVSAAFFTPPPPGTTDCATSSIDPSDAAPPELPAEPTGRVERRPVALYDFRAGRGEVVADVSGVAPPLDLELVGSELSWLDDQGMRFEGGAARSDGPATKVIESAERTGELTFEAWVRSDDLAQEGPTRIATISGGSEQDQVNVHLGEEGEALSVRLRATCGLFNWWTVPDVFTSEDALVHVAVTFAGDELRTYVQGSLVEAERLEGQLGDWDPDYQLVIGDESTLDRPFHGDVLLVAVYDRALSAIDVAQNTAAGPS